MAFLQESNGRLDPRYKDLAKLYKTHGERWNVRWDYAFFQMLIETGNLTFTGDVRPSQNNFAGLGTTGGGVPGDSYPSISTGVLAQIQHLVAYSGERVPNPVGARTQLKQDDIVSASSKLRRPVRFADLARRWAVDPKYGRSIEGVAERYRQGHCAGRAAIDATTGPNTAPRSALGGEPRLVRTAIAPLAAADPIVGNPAARKAAAPTPAPGSAVTTVWTRAVDGDMPPRRIVRPEPFNEPFNGPRPQAQAAGDARIEAAVAASTSAQPSKSVVGPIGIGPSSPTALISKPSPPEPRPPVQPEALQQGATIAFAAAAAPFAAAQVVAEAKNAHGSCRILMASYGGTQTVLIRSSSSVAVELIVLSVVPGFEQFMTNNFIRTRAPRGVVDGEFGNRDLAMVRAKEICPEASSTL
ncbi:MAG: hypothetical protein C0511_01120 [Hyphomicrobium sp.]|nr:hypothetical protein [Hyphomicrobium sp.]PPC83980.1 MAG: hypothetical protein CTY40_01120 [Hyphomicrobium sp.]